MSLRQITEKNGKNNQLLYFTSSSITEESLVYISDTSGHPNLFCRNLATGATRQITQQTEGYMRSYVYFDGQPYAGFGKASPSLDCKNGLVYYLQGTEIRCVSLSGESRLIARLPSDQMTGFTHVSADGRLLCVPTVDAEALDGFIPGVSPFSYMDDKVHTDNLSSYLRVFDTQTGEEVICERVPRCWITHVQFSPIDSSLILYNHEWCRDSGIRRMWLFDGSRHIPMRTEDLKQNRSRDDWTCHEMWQADGAYIIYHGTYANGNAYIGRVRADGEELVEIPLPEEFRSYGHFTSGRLHNDLLVCDGYYRTPDDIREVSEDAAKSNWITIQRVNWEARTIQWIPLVKHESSWQSQDEHPHPIFNDTDSHVFFTSDQSGKRAVYTIETSLI